MANKSFANTFAQLLMKELGISTLIDSRILPDDQEECMGRDKKARDGVIRFVLPERIGHLVSCDTVTRCEMGAGIQYMQTCSAKGR